MMATTAERPQSLFGYRVPRFVAIVVWAILIPLSCYALFFALVGILAPIGELGSVFMPFLNINDGDDYYGIDDCDCMSTTLGMLWFAVVGLGFVAVPLSGATVIYAFVMMARSCASCVKKCSCSSTCDSCIKCCCEYEEI